MAFPSWGFETTFYSLELLTLLPTPNLEGQDFILGFSSLEGLAPCHSLHRPVLIFQPTDNSRASYKQSQQCLNLISQQGQNVQLLCADL